jgi:phosphoesterase RecJ-like protein
VLPELHTAYIAVPAAWQAEFGLAPGDTEGIVNYALGIRGINFAAILIEYPDQVKLSFRSVGQFSAQAFAAHFQGGGHYNAAGGRAPLPLHAVEQRFLDLLPTHAAQLDYARL